MDIESIVHGFPRRREFILEILHSIQDNNPQHYLPEASLKLVAKHLNLPLSQVYGVVGYYSMFSIKPRGKYIISICKSPVCSLMGSLPIMEFLKKELSVDINKTSSDGLFTIKEVECLGRCDTAPSMMINKKYYGDLTIEKIQIILHEYRNK